MSVLTRPLQIGVSDLKRVIGYSHCGALHIKMETFRGRKWKQRYVIISKGCFYIYLDMYSKKPEKAFPLTACESVKACESEEYDEDGFCFRLFETNKKPLLFSCDSVEAREIWLERIQSALLEVHPNLSADSGYDGSASSIPGTTFGSHSLQVDSYMYDDVNDRDRKVKESFPVQAFGASEVSSHHTHKTVPKTVYVPERDSQPASHSRTELDFVSVRGGVQNISLTDSVSVLSVRKGQESDNTDSDHSDGDNSSPDIMYENPEQLVKKFTREDYHRKTKKNVKKKMEGKPEGTFVVYPGEETRLTLCVMTPKGLKYFRIHEQNERVSLFKDFSRAPNVFFPTLDTLLFHYHYHDLPGDGYSVKLKKKSVV